jgi:hypothetical protein
VERLQNDEKCKQEIQKALNTFDQNVSSIMDGQGPVEKESVQENSVEKVGDELEAQEEGDEDEEEDEEEEVGEEEDEAEDEEEAEEVEEAEEAEEGT